MRGPVGCPIKKLNITTRKSPCGEGTNTYEHWQMRIYKRYLDVIGSPVALKKIMSTVKAQSRVNVDLLILSTEEKAISE
eukprot:gnl/Chilomastix_caulleri/1821.p1 GENE.gnl/Chilomastix_caulleri/1821~~gnl/Chilomastix_caulleri/1821.p1  ORF type:complete len:79 (+),score=18.43 gnl/Chilomastix_caulleri/1821:288-524(+)